MSEVLDSLCVGVSAVLVIISANSESITAILSTKKKKHLVHFKLNDLFTIGRLVN